jgi:hypothetical protein
MIGVAVLMTQIDFALIQLIVILKRNSGNFLSS